MATEFSFDVVSKVDLQEVSNAVQQASKEIATRFDFRGSASKIEWNEKELELTLTSDDAHKLKSVVDILETRLFRLRQFDTIDHFEICRIQNHYLVAELIKVLAVL